MLQLESGRHAALRDLDAITSRLHGLDNDDWNRPTPNEGWQIRDLVAHLSASVLALTGRLTTIVVTRRGTPIQSDVGIERGPVSRDDAPARLIASLTRHRNLIRHVLIALAEDDMEAPLDDPAANVPRQLADGRGQLTTCVFEFGIHRYDLDIALDERDAGLPREAIQAADDLIGSRLVEIATHEGTRPPAPVAYHLAGALIDRWLTWDGSRWSSVIPEADTIPVVQIQGAESVVALFLCGRITADDRLLGVRGDMDAARAFKEYVPGPFTI